MATTQTPYTPPEMYAPFYRAAESGQVVLPHCAGCEHWHWFPQPLCPHCSRDDWSWHPVAGPARVFTWTTVHRAFSADLRPKVPFTIVLVEFDDAPGPRLLTNLRDGCDPSGLHVGDVVTVESGIPVGSTHPLPLVATAQIQ